MSSLKKKNQVSSNFTSKNFVDASGTNVVRSPERKCQVINLDQTPQ